MADCYANGKVLVFPCGGGSNTGEIADRVARQMQKNNLGKMSCLASLGAHLDGFIISARDADQNITIDGCQLACARKIFEHLGLKSRSYILTEMGVVKGQTPVSSDIIENLMTEIGVGIETVILSNQTNGCCYQ